MRLLVGNAEVQPAPVSRAPDQPEVDRIALTVPANQTGCYLPVLARTGLILSNIVTISVAPEAEEGVRRSGRAQRGRVDNAWRQALADAWHRFRSAAS
ncbi:MAG: hypothetical protein U0Q16_05160 [Bryobacteraceae bacterium]